MDSRPDILTSIESLASAEDFIRLEELIAQASRDLRQARAVGACHLIAAAFARHPNASRVALRLNYEQHPDYDIFLRGSDGTEAVHHDLNLPSSGRFPSWHPFAVRGSHDIGSAIEDFCKGLALLLENVPLRSALAACNSESQAVASDAEGVARQFGMDELACDIERRRLAAAAGSAPRSSRPNSI